MVLQLNPYDISTTKGQEWKGTIKIIFQYLLNDIQKKPRSFKIGIFSIFIVIGFLAAIQSAFRLSPVIFLSVAEDQVGDTDIIITPQSFQNTTSTSSTAASNPLSNIRLLNSTLLSNICETSPQVQGCAPRWILPAKLFNANDNPTTRPVYRSYAISIDSMLERSVGLGRRFKEDILSEGTVYLTGSTARGLGLAAGQNVSLNLDLVGSILTNTNLVSLNLTNTTNSGVEDFIAQQINVILLDQVPILKAADGSQANISKQQLIDISAQLDTFSQQSDTPANRQNFYDQTQLILDQSNVKVNSKDLFGPTLDSGNAQNLSQAINTQANALPNTFLLNSSSISKAMAPIVLRALNVTTSYRIQKEVDSPKGKWASALGNVIIVDSKYILKYLWSSVSANIDASFNDPAVIASNPSIPLVKTYYYDNKVSERIAKNISQIDLNNYAITSNVVVDNRVDLYSSSKSITSGIVGITNIFTVEVAKHASIQVSVPLSSSVNALLLLKMFLDNMIAVSLFLLVMLAILLIYSLMISDIEEKTYEFGMLRALGFEKRSLVHLIVYQGLIFAIPGLALGLLMAYLLNSIISYFIFNQAVLVTSYNLHWSAVILAIGLGLIIPLISVYLPIQRAMSKTLRDSLDLYHRVVNEISVSVQKLEKLGVSFAQSMNAILLIVMGVVCYYFAPAAFVYQNIALFLAIINIVLILMILGFTLLINLTQPWVERLFVKFFLIFLKKYKHLEPIIVKNMQGHRRRNSKTALMYTIAMSFLIFAGTGFNLQSKTIGDNLKNTLGSDIKVLLLNDKTGINESGMRGYLQSYMQRHPNNINDFSFASLPINSFPGISKPYFSTLGDFPANKNLELRGIEENYLQSVYLDFYFPMKFDPTMNFATITDNNQKKYRDSVSGLFSKQGTQPFDNSVDFYKISTNSRVRDQTIMGGGDPKDPESESLDYVSNSNLAIQKTSRAQFPDEEILLIIPSGLQYISSVDVGVPAQLEFSPIKYRAKIRATSKKFPGFKFSSYRQVSFYGEILTGMKQFRYILDSLYTYNGWINNPLVIDFFAKVKTGSSYGIPKSALTVRFKRELSKDEREEIANGLRNFFESDYTQLFDVPGIITTLNETMFYIDLFSMVVAAIAIILSFFLILVSFVANIKENSWEFGVLRAVGLSKDQIQSVYMIESCSLIISSGVLGTIIGIVVAVTLTLQFLMFTELPFTFIFPYRMFLFTFLSGIVISAGASYSALRDFKDKPIATIVKGLI